MTYREQRQAARTLFLHLRKASAAAGRNLRFLIARAAARLFLLEAPPGNSERDAAEGERKPPVDRTRDLPLRMAIVCPLILMYRFPSFSSLTFVLRVAY